MGCQQSIPSDAGSSFEEKTRIVTKSGLDSERNKACKTQSAVETPSDFSCSSRTAATISSTSSASLGVDEDESYRLPKVDCNGHLLMEEIVRRTSSSIQCSSLTVGEGKETFELKYAFRSQRGYNPLEPTKPNQEKYGVTRNFASEGTGAMIGVFSGHGEEGRQCASFSHTTLPKQLAKFIRQTRVQRYKKILQASGHVKQGAWNPKMWPMLSASDYEQCCKRAFQETNSMLHQEQEIDDRFSGVSVASVCFHGGRMYVCNVGDCRVILGRRSTNDCTQSSNQFHHYDGEEEKCEIEELERCTNPDKQSDSLVGGQRIAIPLTETHTTRSLKEQERITLAGAEVKRSCEIEDTGSMLALKEPDESESKSLRVFLPGKAYPNTKYTRSLGDSSSEEIGIFSDPNVISCDLTASDDTMVVASNGVFQFLTDQEVIDICVSSSNPLEASEYVTRAAYERWIEHSNRCEDISVIVGFLSSTNNDEDSSPKVMESSVDFYMPVMVDITEEE
mmetsp:Transcript_5237/g.15229  ORF Transcript_5237/g.15229 Transcript_5237/m.15229 type:complete len:506 (+) Transcript_5237:189-1706(+)